MAKRIFDNQGNTFGIRLVLQNHGIAFLQLDYGATETDYLMLSDIFTPFDDLADWLLAIKNHQGKHLLTIDGEGYWVRCKAVSYDENLSIEIFRDDFDATVLSTVFDKKAFLKLFRNEIHRFFTWDFDGRKFGGRYDQYKILKDNTKERILKHPFLAYPL